MLALKILWISIDQQLPKLNGSQMHVWILSTFPWCICGLHIQTVPPTHSLHPHTVCLLPSILIHLGHHLLDMLLRSSNNLKNNLNSQGLLSFVLNLRSS